MMATLPTLAVIALAVGPTDIGFGVASEYSIARAESAFEARRAELGLIGTAPMCGLERLESLTGEDFEARRTELGLLGSAPMVGLERLSREAPIEREASKPASVERVVIWSARNATH